MSLSAAAGNGIVIVIIMFMFHTRRIFRTVKSLKLQLPQLVSSAASFFFSSFSVLVFVFAAHRRLNEL